MLNSLDLKPNELREAELRHRKQTRVEVGQGNPKFGRSCSAVVSLAKEVAVRDAGVTLSRHRAQLSHPPAGSGIAHTCSLLPLSFPHQLHHLQSSTFPLKSHTCFYSRQSKNPLTSTTPLNLQPRNKTSDTLRLPCLWSEFTFVISGCKKMTLFFHWKNNSACQI